MRASDSGHRPAVASGFRTLVSWAGVASVLIGLFGVAGCRSASAGPGTVRQRVIDVVAAENFWGSIAAQLGGVHARVHSIITNPDADPHSYEPTAADARAVAGANLVLENGIGYDPWVGRLLSADSPLPATIDVGTSLGLTNGANPHRWYNPGDVRAVIETIVRSYRRLDPADGAYFDAKETWFENVALRPYDAAISSVRSRFHGTPVGASESIFSMLAPALGLDLITPASFLKAISEGTDVSASDKQTADRQIMDHAIKIYVYNSQNVTPDVQVQLAEARAAHIPVTTITETLAPAGTTFQTWQTFQLLRIEAALASAASSH